MTRIKKFYLWLKEKVLVSSIFFLIYSYPPVIDPSSPAGEVGNLYPSVPISRSIDVVMGFVKDDYAEICQRTKLDLEDIERLLRLCLNKCYFLWDNKIFVIEDAGPIGLSLMVTMAEAYLQFLEAKSLSEALHCRPKTFRRYVDDSHPRFDDAEHAEEF